MSLHALRFLGLRPDADERAIKRAYAARLRTTRPDEDPEGFQRLNEAYQAALAWRQRHPPGGDDTGTAGVAPPAEPDDGRFRDPQPFQDAVVDDDDAPAAASADAETDTRSPPAPPPTGDDRFRRPPPGMPPSRPAFPEPSAPPAPRDEQRETQRLAGQRVRQDDLVRFHYACFELAANASPEGFRAWLIAQPLLLSLQYKARIGRSLLEAFAHERPPVRHDNFAVFCAFFGFDDIGSGHDALALQGLADDMDLLWRAAGGGRPGTRITLPSDERGWPRFGTERGHALIAEARRRQRMHQASLAWARYPELRRPWSWPDILFRSLFLERERRIAELLSSFDEDVWPPGTNRLVARFWLDAASGERPMTTARRIVHAVRWLVYGGGSMLLALAWWRRPAGSESATFFGTLLIFAMVALAIVVSVRAMQWQGRSDPAHPVMRGVHRAAVPALLLAAFVLGNLPPYYGSVLPASAALAIAQHRYRTRNGGLGWLGMFRRIAPWSWLQVVLALTLMIGVIPFIHFVATSPWGIPVFSWTCAAVALWLWGADLRAQRQAAARESTP